MPVRVRSESKGQDRDVVVLAVDLGSTGDGVGGLVADGRGAVEAEEFTSRVLSLHDAVGQQGQMRPGRKRDGRFRTARAELEAEREPVFQAKLFAVKIGRQVACIGPL